MKAAAEAYVTTLEFGSQVIIRYRGDEGRVTYYECDEHPSALLMDNFSVHSV